MTNPTYRGDMGQSFNGQDSAGSHRTAWADDSQLFPNHIMIVSASAHLPREQAERLRDWITTWLERDPLEDLFLRVLHNLEGVQDREVARELASNARMFFSSEEDSDG
jgi:hypothetical protein